ncbi:endonuclease [Lentzea californiensis]|uniref:endonuclease n=1 Tax=Lentzea californiensis TaxID=438851 RepID=UPI002164D745|nr:endonuclease [Lentzea californiensis]MCR3748772.1 Endonuclease I [Lentzea californiensis]
MARWSPLALVVALLAAVGLYGSTAAVAAAPLTVAQAIATQNGSSATVRGYVVGQPTATTTVLRSGYPNDYALALADSASTTSTSSMVYVQIPSSFRAAWGMRTNPSLLGKQIDVTGSLSAYFSHAGLTSATAFAFAATTPPPTSGTTTPPPSDCPAYYAAACGKSGAALKSALNGIIRGHTKLTYTQVWEALKVTDQDPNNSANVILLYSGTSRSKTANGGDQNDWNREHVWPQSHGPFDTSTDAGTDLHHLRPEDVTVNGVRGNLDFDNGGTQTHPEAPGNVFDADSWEPRNAVKGDVARMLFYMAVRYESGDQVNLELNNSTSNGSQPYMGKLSVLKQWNLQDPPDASEQRRNQVIFDSYQRNRNPFIDDYKWADLIWP